MTLEPATRPAPTDPPTDPAIDLPTDPEWPTERLLASRPRVRRDILYARVPEELSPAAATFVVWAATQVEGGVRATHDRARTTGGGVDSSDVWTWDSSWASSPADSGGGGDWGGGGDTGGGDSGSGSSD